MHHGVHVAVANHLGDERIPDVGPHELSTPHPAQQILARRDGINRDDVVDQGVLREPGGQVATEKPTRTGDQHDLGILHGIPGVGAIGVVAVVVRRPARRIHRHSLAGEDWGYLPNFLRCTRVRRSSLRCFFFDIRLRRFLMTEPMNSAT
jgi:hypothetical protein